MFPLFNKVQMPLMHPDTTPIEDKELSVDDIVNALGSSDGKEDVKTDNDEGEEPHIEEKVEEESDDSKKEDDKPEEEKELEEELKALEEELKDPTDEDLELKTPVNRRELYKKYPDLKKQFPEIDTTIFRERQYTELLPTINDAKEALAALTTLDNFEKDLKEGKTTDMMKAVLADDPNAFAKLADNYMSNLAAVDERAYHHVLGNITKDIVTAMINFGKEKENEEVQNAASILYQFMFNSTKWEGKKSLAVNDVVDDSIRSEKAKLAKEKQDYENSRLKDNTDKLMGSIDNQIKSTIEKSIDTKNQMSSFVRTKAVEEVLNKAKNLIEKDTRFGQIIKQLTDRSIKEKFSDESLNRIRSTYYRKYNSILIPIIKAVKSEALKGNNSRNKEKEENNDTTERANRDTTVRNVKGGNNDKNKPLPGESSADFLLRRA